MLNVLRCQLTYYGQVVTNAEARFNNSLRPRKPEGSLERTAQDGHLDSHTAPELSRSQNRAGYIIYAGSDFPHPFELRLSKEGMDHTVQNQPRSDLDGLVRVWPNASGLEASRCSAGIIWPGFWQDATSPLLSADSVPFFHRRPG